MSEFQIEGQSVSMWLRVKPHASRECLRVDSLGQLVLEVHAPPAEGRANQACIRYLARALRLPPSRVEIVSGERARRKRIRIGGGSAPEIVRALRVLAGTTGF